MEFMGEDRRRGRRKGQDQRKIYLNKNNKTRKRNKKAF